MYSRQISHCTILNTNIRFIGLKHWSSLFDSSINLEIGLRKNKALKNKSSIFLLDLIKRSFFLHGNFKTIIESQKHKLDWIIIYWIFLNRSLAKYRTRVYVCSQMPWLNKCFDGLHSPPPKYLTQMF